MIKWSKPGKVQVSAAIALAAGAVSFVVSHSIYHTHPWWSNLLTNIGVAFVLAIPLTIIAYVFNDALIKTKEKVSRLSLSLDDLRTLSSEARSQNLQDELKVFQSIKTDVRFDSLQAALQKAHQRGYIHSHGIRVELQDSHSTHLRFQLVAKRVFRKARISLIVERDDGSQVAKIDWLSGQPAIEIVNVMTIKLQRGGNLPFDLDLPAALQELSDLLIFVAECKYNVRDRAIGDATTLGSVDHWIFTNRGLTPKDRYYSIVRARIDKPADDWEKQIQGKNWDSAESFPRAYDIAKNWYPNLDGISAE